MRAHHTDAAVCPLCTQKLETAHPLIAGWFREMKSRHPTLHVSWAYRGKKDQERVFADRASNAPWPKSPHNHEKDGKPCSLALDVFQLIDGKAVFDPVFCARLHAENEKDGIDLIWGGNFKHLGDSGHFQIAL